MTRKHLRPLAAVVSVALLLGMIGCSGGNGTNNVTPSTTAPPATGGGTTGGSSGSAGGGGQQTGATQSPVKRVIVLVLQNHSFDNLFGTFPGADGIRVGVPGYSQVNASGATVTPSLITTDATADLVHQRSNYVAAWDQGKMDQYAAVEGDLAMGYYDNTQAHVATLWSYASQYALADRYFASVMSSEPANMLYMVSGADDIPQGVQPAYGPCNSPDLASKPYTWTNLGDALSAKGVGWTWFHENYGMCGGGYVVTENPFQYFTSTQNSAHLQDLGAFYTALAADALPPVSFVNPVGAHNMHPGSGPISRAIDWVDGFIQKVQASPGWPNTAIVVVWDESGGFWDHVPPPQVDAQGYGARVPMMVISPLAKRGYISHLQMDHTSVLNFIQWNWGLPAVNGRSALDGSVNLKDMFQF